MSNYYEDRTIVTERVTLAEDIILPKISKEPLTLSFFETNNEYKLAANEYTDMKGKFYLKIMTPLLSKDSATNTRGVSPILKGQNKLNTSNYTSANYITLVIPKYILLNFVDKVPAGTEFIISTIDGSTDIEDLKIIGIYSI